jgi:hypothetical protein
MRSEVEIREIWNPDIFAFARVEPPGPITKPDFPSLVGDWQAASLSLANTLHELVPGAFEFLPFRTRTSIGEDITVGYTLLHYLKWVDAIDRRHSRLVAGETRYPRLTATCEDYYLEHVVLSQRKLTEPVCRVRGWSEYHLFREDIVIALKEGGFNGLRFEEVAVV